MEFGKEESKAHGEFTIEEQRDLFRRLGYNPKQWNPDDPAEVDKVTLMLAQAQLNLADSGGNDLSPRDISLLTTLTGRYG